MLVHLKKGRSAISLTHSRAPCLAHQNLLSPTKISAKISPQIRTIFFIDKNSQACDFCLPCRPWSEINAACKIPFKELASHLKKLCPLIIDPDQIGFIKNRSSSHGMWQLFSTMHFSCKYHKELLALSLHMKNVGDSAKNNKKAVFNVISWRTSGLRGFLYNV